MFFVENHLSVLCGAVSFFQNEKIKTSDKYFDDDAIIKLSKDDTYCMSLLNNALTIKPISEYFSDWSDSDIYFLTND